MTKIDVFAFTRTHEEKLKGFVDITEKQLNYIYRHDHNFFAQIQCFDMI